MIDLEGVKGSRFRFGKGVYESKGIVTISLNIRTLVFHVVKTKIPFLICLKDLNTYSLYYNNLTN